jgi:hypothetical protein
LTNPFELIVPDDLTSQQLFEGGRKKNNSILGVKLAPVIVPKIGIKKGLVSQETLNLMKKRLLGKSDSKSKWVPNGT